MRKLIWGNVIMAGKNKFIAICLVVFSALSIVNVSAKDCDWVFDKISKKDLNFPSENCNMNFYNAHGETPLFSALGSGYFAIAQKVADYGADVNLNTAHGNNVIVFALAYGRQGLDLIASHGWRPVNTIDISGQLLVSMKKSFKTDKIPTMLLAVIEGGGCVEYLYKIGVRIDPGYDSLLIDNMLRVDYLDIPILKKSGLNVNAYSPDGFTLLHFAVGMKNIKLVRMLLSVGADKYLVDSKLKLNSIELAVRTGDRVIINCLNYNKCNGVAK